jgi:hypothetical protein
MHEKKENQEERRNTFESRKNVSKQRVLKTNLN